MGPTRLEPHLRLFIGLAIPEPAASELDERTRQAAAQWSGSIRRSTGADLHVTLRFLGEVGPDRVPALGEVLEQLRQPSVPVALPRVGVFRGAGVIYAEVQAAPDLLSLQQGLSEALAWRGFPGDLREFHPHVTLARRRHGIPQTDVDRWNSTWHTLDLLLGELVLFQSVTAADGHGRRYERLREVRLL